MIEHQKEKCHWEFLFLGADIDAVSVADRFGIRANRAVRYEHDSAGTQLNFEVLEKAVRFARCATSAAQMSIRRNTGSKMVCQGDAVGTEKREEPDE